jgi:acyl transferase domain-containing protein
VYGKGRQPDQPLLVGSVKANISHLEAAGGISGVIKTVLALQHGLIPPQAHFDAPSPHIPWQRLPVKMVTEATTWPETDLRLAGVTALGLVGTNAHVVLSSSPYQTRQKKTALVDEDMAADQATELLVLSARNETALIQLADHYRQFIQKHPGAKLVDLCHSAASGRRHFECRVALTINSADNAIQKLTRLIGEPTQIRNGKVQGIEKQSENGQSHGFPSNGAPRSGAPIQDRDDGVSRGVCKGTPKIAWVFTGNHDAELNSARELFAIEPVFNALMHEFDQRLSKHLAQANRPNIRLQDWLGSPSDLSSAPSELHVFALQAGLAKLWMSWGVEPDVVLGFGVGQYTASCVAGGLCFFDALVLVAERNRVLTELGTDATKSDNTSKVLDSFEAIADKFNYYPPNLPLICSIRGEEVPVHRSLGGSYWRQHCSSADATADAMKTLTGMHCDYVLEIGPARGEDESEWSGFISGLPVQLASLKSNQRVAQTLLETLGQLYVGGVNPDFKSLNQHRARNRISLPSYPFQKKRYWITEIADHMDKEIETVTR